MIKTKNQPVQRTLVTTGYILFTLLVIGVLISTTIPFGIMLFNPKVLHYNVVAFTIALTVGALLPAIVGYLVGDHAVKSKSKLSHHFNGVLFGLMSYWLMSVATVVINFEYLTAVPSVRMTILNLVPSIGVAVITSIIAIMHVRSRQAKHDLIEYKPFVITLLAAVVFMPVYSLINSAVTSGVDVYSLTALGVLILLGALSYLTLRKTKLSHMSKLAWSMISVTVLYVMVYVSYQLFPTIVYYFQTQPTMEFQSITGGIAWVLALIGWIIYWIIQVKTLSRER